jgi:UDP-N-acetylmuramoylalanine--D-glutamate ligase
MNPAFDTYIQSMAGRDVTVIGAGVSNSPLISH